MSIRTHAPDCAKTRALIESEEDSTERRHVECTCGATYVPGAAASDELEHVFREEARKRHEAGAMRLALEWGVEDTCPPWRDKAEWMDMYRKAKWGER